MNNHQIIVITGKLASGKSTLANSLSKELNIPCYIKDIYKEHLVDEYGFSNREENRALSVKAVDMMLEILSKNVKKLKDIILEANFRKGEIQSILDICKTYNYNVLLFILNGDNKILYERFLSRLANRHKAHMSLELDKDYSKFEAYNNDLINQVIGFNHIDIDTTSISEDEVLLKVKECCEKIINRQNCL